jgi:hypothetical protein
MGESGDFSPRELEYHETNADKESTYSYKLLVHSTMRGRPYSTRFRTSKLTCRIDNQPSIPLNLTTQLVQRTHT